HRLWRLTANPAALRLVHHRQAAQSSGAFAAITRPSKGDALMRPRQLVASAASCCERQDGMGASLAGRLPAGACARLNGSKSQRRQPGMLDGTRPCGPTEPSVDLGNAMVIDAGNAPLHEPVDVELPVL